MQMIPTRFRHARGRKRPIPGTMNKTEQAYADHLTLQLRAGEIERLKNECSVKDEEWLESKRLWNGGA